MSNALKRPFVVGLTGGIGSGKSTVAALFAERGAILVDTDVIAHEVTAIGGAALHAIKAEFGSKVLQPDGAMDRAAMRELVFNDANAKKTLEAIVHPLIRDRVQLALQQPVASYLIVVVPLLVESGNWRSRVERILVVDCSEALQLTRVMQRSALTEEQVGAIMATQATRHQRQLAADDLITNESDTAALIAQVEPLHRRYCLLATQQK